MTPSAPKVTVPDKHTQFSCLGLSYDWVVEVARGGEVWVVVGVS